MPPLVYWNTKYTHTGVTAYKVFENCQRSIHNSSLKNLLHVGAFTNETLRYYINAYNICIDADERLKISDECKKTVSPEDFEIFLQETNQHRKLNPGQCRRIKSLSNKLAYYSAKRIFQSKKTGTYSMKVAFLTLTCPESTTGQQATKAFNHFLSYLSRTANAVYVWKKELGETNGKLHFHILINNFIPYYIVSWKWKRLLLAEGVSWPIKADGTHTDSHYRIELPRSQKLVAHYIAKYMSKAYDLPREYGYISGHSPILDELKEIDILLEDCPREELDNLARHSKVIAGDYVSLICCDLLHCGNLAPKINALFERQYIDFCERITLPQKFNFVS